MKKGIVIPISGSAASLLGPGIFCLGSGLVVIAAQSTIFEKTPFTSDEGFIESPFSIGTELDLVLWIVGALLSVTGALMIGYETCRIHR